jgi:hypothetical protein
MTLLVGLLAAGGWATALVLLLLLPARARPRDRQIALQLRSRVLPYLRRRQAELDGPVDPPSSSPLPTREEVTDEICHLADWLTSAERVTLALGDTLNVAASDTMPGKAPRER